MGSNTSQAQQASDFKEPKTSCLFSTMLLLYCG